MRTWTRGLQYNLSLDRTGNYDRKRDTCDRISKDDIGSGKDKGGGGRGRGGGVRVNQGSIELAEDGLRGPFRAKLDCELIEYVQFYRLSGP